jgi:aspartyl-tRNA(Asn)/glutamyl-tRNA(Gln) amidotransferase subunit C
MKVVDQLQVQSIAQLARLRFDEQELTAFTAQLNQILEYVEQLNELDTTAIEPTAQTAFVQPTLGEDQVQQGLSNQQLVQNAPSHLGGLITVPRVLDES